MENSTESQAEAVNKQNASLAVKIEAVQKEGLANEPVTTNINKNNQQELLAIDCVYVESIKGRFIWNIIYGHYIPYIIRVIDGDFLKFISVRMAEKQLFRTFIKYLHEDIYTCTSIKSHFISDSEAQLFNEINLVHADSIYGKEMFVAEKDCIASLEDVHEFYTFIDLCNKKIQCNIPPGDNEKCGFIRINSESVVPYCTQEGQKYLPIFYFEGATEMLIPRSLKFENWNLAYLKFCFKIQGTINELPDSDFCEVASLDYIKSFFKSDTNFEEYWPATVVDIHFLTNQKSNHVNPPGVWIRAPPEVVSAENSIPRTLIEPVPMILQSIAVTRTLNRYPANQMINSYTTQPQVPPISQSIAVTRTLRTLNVYPANHVINSCTTQPQPQPQVPVPPISQSIAVTRTLRTLNVYPANHVINSYTTQSQHQPQPPSTDQNYCIPAINQSTAGQCNNSGFTMSRGISLINGAANVGRLTPLVRAAVHTNTAPVIDITASYSNVVTSHFNVTTMYNPKTYNYVMAHQSRMRKLNSQRNNNNQFQQQQMQSRPVRATVQENYLRRNHGYEFTRIPDRPYVHNGSNNYTAYQIQNVVLQGRVLQCINARAYLYSDLLVTLNDLVQMAFLKCTITRCAYVLNNYLNVKIYVGNSEQLALLRSSRRHWLMNPEEVPMAMLESINRVWPQLQTLVYKNDEEIQHQSGLFKRQKLSSQWTDHRGRVPVAGSSSSNSSNSSNGPTSTLAATTGFYSAIQVNRNNCLNAGTPLSQSPYPHHPPHPHNMSNTYQNQSNQSPPPPYM